MITMSEARNDLRHARRRALAQAKTRGFGPDDVVTNGFRWWARDVYKFKPASSLCPKLALIVAPAHRKEANEQAAYVASLAR